MPFGIHPRHERVDLGVLFVHGIGLQRRGDTLQSFGAALERWFSARAAATPGDFEVEISDSALRSGASGSGGPTVATLELAKTSTGERARWALEESWWADDFKPPRMKQIFGWGLQILPWTVITHFWSRIRQALWHMYWTQSLPDKAFAAARAVILEPVALLGGILLAPVFLLALLGLTILALVPIDAVRAFVLRAQSLLTATIGDSFIFVAEPIQRGAILGRVRRDYRALAARAGAVAIVAHSQGAAIAHRLIRDFEDVRPDLLVTFGSGVNKLVRLEAVRRGRSWRTWLPPVVAALGVALFAGVAWIGFFTAVEEGWRWWHGASLVLVLGLWCAALSTARWGRREAEDSDRARRAARRSRGATWLLVALVGVWLASVATSPSISAAGVVALIAGLVFFGWGIWMSEERFDKGSFELDPDVEWVDIHTRLDPVPNGALPWYVKARPVEVANRGSALRDHTAYPANGDSFLSEVARCLAALGGGSWLTLDAERTSHATRRRVWRVGWLRAARWVAGLSVAAVLLSGRANLVSVAGALEGRVGAALTATLDALIGRLHALPLLGERLRPSLTAAGEIRGLQRPPSDAVLGGGAVVAAGLLAFALVWMAWLVWNALEVRRLGRGYRAFEAPFAAMLFLLAWMAGAVALGLGGLLPRLDGDAILASGAAGLAAALVWTAVVALRGLRSGEAAPATEAGPAARFLTRALAGATLSLFPMAAARSGDEGWLELLAAWPRALEHSLGGPATVLLVGLILLPLSPVADVLRARWRRWSHSGSGP